MNAMLQIGSLSLELPPAQANVPTHFWENLIFGFVLEREGHQTLAHRQIGRVQAWLNARRCPAADTAAKRAAFEHWFGISAPQASLLTRLFDAEGRYVTTEDLSAAERVSHEALITRVSRLRQAMDCEAIDSERGAGYRLTEIGIGECRMGMDRFRESLA